MGYFSEMSLNMQEGRKPSAAALTGENAFEEEESFDELPVPPVIRSSVQPLNQAAPQPGSDAASSVSTEMMEAPEDDPVEENGGCDDVDDIKTDVPAGNGASKDADEEKRRAEHETAEAKRKAEWEAKQAEKKRALQEQMDHLAAMSDDEVVSASMQRVSKDVEKLTRRNMKECVSEYIQTLCLDDPAFARLTMHPKKTMIHCFQYISRKAWDYVQDELKANGIQPGQGGQGYGCDIPDDLCYQWAEDYFRDPDAKEDQEQEENVCAEALYWQDHGNTGQEKESGKETRRKEEAGTKAGAGKETFC